MTQQDDRSLPPGFSRRGLLRAGLMLPAAYGVGGALLAACSSTPSPSSASTPSTAKEDFSGITLQIGTNPGDQPALQEYATGWAAKTGGKAVVQVVPFAERAIKFAGFVASEDGSMDLMYADPAFIAEFGSRLYMDLNGKLDTKPLLSSVVQAMTLNGGLYGAPLSSDMEMFIYNKTMFAKAGADPDNPPQTIEGIYALADKLHTGNIYGNLTPWLAGYARTYWMAFYNGLGKPMYNEDFTTIEFNNENGLKVFQSIKDGLDNKFYDPNVLDDPGADQDTAILFAEGKGASQWGTSQYWSEAYKGTQTKLKPEEVGAASMPAIVAGHFGTVNAFEAVGINKFSKHPEAALSYLDYMTSFAGQKNMMVKGTSGLPSVRSDVLTDPDVKKIFPIGGVLAEQGTKPSGVWPSPYNTLPIFSAALNGIVRNSWSATQALDYTVSQVRQAITQYLSS
jgi:multiple sugar transport system substrate-binding protein